MHIKSFSVKFLSRSTPLRPDTHTIMMHPYFWTPERRLLFLIDSSDRFEKEKDLEKDGKYKSPHINALERDAVNVVKTDWLKKIDRAFYEEVMGNKRRGYDGEKVLDLLRVIRNKVCYILLDEILAFAYSRGRLIACREITTKTCPRQHNNPLVPYRKDSSATSLEDFQTCSCTSTELILRQGLRVKICKHTILSYLICRLIYWHIWLA